MSNVASDILFAFSWTHCQPVDDPTRWSPGVYVRGNIGDSGAPGSQLCQQHPFSDHLLLYPDWAWSWPDVHSIHCGLCPLLHQKQVTYNSTFRYTFQHNSSPNCWFEKSGWEYRWLVKVLCWNVSKIKLCPQIGTLENIQCRSLAIGICLCGVGTGTFALAPISNMILEKYGWRNVMRQAESM